MTFFAISNDQVTCPISRNTRIEDRVCALIQGTSLVLGIGGVATMVALAGVYGSASAIVGFSIYGATLILMYAASTAYHATSKLKRKFKLRIVDKSNIYLLIAGTYTPFVLVTIEGGWGWSLFGVVWGMALFGVAFKLIFVDRFEFVSLGLYLSMGWVMMVAFYPLVNSMPWEGVFWLVMGGVAYTLGVPIYRWERMPFNHALWHLFVFAGSVILYFTLMFYVLFQP